MSPRRPRLASAAVLFLLAAAAVGLASCASQEDGPAGDLSQLGHKGQSMLRVADASRQAGDCGAAIRFYGLVKDQDEHHVEITAARIGTADCELSLGALPEAKRDYRLAVGLAPQDPTPLIGLGRIALLEHKPAEAANYLDQAIHKGADAAFVWNDRGVADDQLRQHKEAQQAYRRGLVKFPDDRALRNNLALSLAMTRDFAEAETLLRALVAEPGATARTRQNLALVLGLEGNLAEAREVAQNDLDGAALDNNGRFYQYARALITGAPLPAETALSDPSESDNPATAARAEAAPVPPPVLVQDPPLHGLRAAEPPSFEQDSAALAAADLPAPPAAAGEPQTAALPAPGEAATDEPPPAASGAATAAATPPGVPTRIVAADGGALKTQTAEPGVVASSENR